MLAVATDGADPTPNALEQLAAAFVNTEARRLVIVHERREPLSGTARWLRRRSLAMHHHVAMNDAAPSRASTASSTARRSASLPAVAARCALRTSGSTKR